jgi:lipoprotein-anchoring transpeptidase ErfK/SrfK
VRSVTLLVLAAALAGCSAHHGSAGTDGDPSASTAAAETPAPPPVRLSIAPAPGRTIARPDRGITVRVQGGTITKVVVRSGDERIRGTLNPARTLWRTRWALGVSRRYTVTAIGRGPSGDPVTEHRAFRTLTPEHTFAPRTIMVDHGTYGVGMPLILYFDDPAVDRKAVERSLEVRTSRPVTGSWYWDDQCGIVPLCLYFRPKRYWKPHTQVHWTAHANGVRFAPGVFGDADLGGTIEIGRSLKVVASTAKHYMDVYRDGKHFAHWPISTGKPGDDTPNGRYLSIEKRNPETMVGEGYRISVPYSVRITWSGVYLHAASWSVGSQGSTNVSHGCINMAPENAATYYEMSIPGDPVKVKGSSRAGTFDNGWTMWFKSWREWRDGSALGRVVRADRHGSTFVG